MRKYFYCHNCKHEDKDFQFDSERKDRDKVTWVNPRDGWGMMITHVICPKCGDVLSGYMRIRPSEEEEEDLEGLYSYLKHTLTLYQSDEEGMMIKNLARLKENVRKDHEKRWRRKEGGV